MPKRPLLFTSVDSPVFHGWLTNNILPKIDSPEKPFALQRLAAAAAEAEVRPPPVSVLDADRDWWEDKMVDRMAGSSAPGVSEPVLSVIREERRRWQSIGGEHGKTHILHLNRSDEVSFMDMLLLVRLPALASCEPSSHLFMPEEANSNLHFARDAEWYHLTDKIKTTRFLRKHLQFRSAGDVLECGAPLLERHVENCIHVTLEADGRHTGPELSSKTAAIVILNHGHHGGSSEVVMGSAFAATIATTSIASTVATIPFPTAVATSSDRSCGKRKLRESFQWSGYKFVSRSTVAIYVISGAITVIFPGLKKSEVLVEEGWTCVFPAGLWHAIGCTCGRYLTVAW